MFALDPHEIQRLLSGINLRSAWGRRDYLLILFKFHTGLRIGELCQLLVTHVAHEGSPRDELYLPAVFTKTRKARTIPLNDTAQECVAKLLAFNRERGFSTAPAAPIFVWKNHRRLPPREAQRMMQQLREKVGFSPKATPHTLRHSFATHLVKGGADVRHVGEILGHRDLNSTTCYTPLEVDDLRQLLRGHPLAERPVALGTEVDT